MSFIHSRLIFSIHSLFPLFVPLHFTLDSFFIFPSSSPIHSFIHSFIHSLINLSITSLFLFRSLFICFIHSFIPSFFLSRPLPVPSVLPLHQQLSPLASQNGRKTRRASCSLSKRIIYYLGNVDVTLHYTVVTGKSVIIKKG